MSLKDLIAGKYVSFSYYQDGNLYYELLGKDFVFPVPIADCGSARFHHYDKAIIFMRWIRRHMELLNDSKNNS